MSKLSAQVEELEEALASTQDRCMNCEDRIALQASQLTELSDALVTARQNIDLQTKRIKELTADLTKARDEIDVRQNKIEDLTLDLTETQRSRTNWKSALLLTLAVVVFIGMPVVFNIGKHYGVCQ